MNSDLKPALRATSKPRRRVAANLAAQEIPVLHGPRSATSSFDWTNDATWDACPDGVERALGSPPKDFFDCAREIATTDVWRNVA